MENNIQNTNKGMNNADIANIHEEVLAIPETAKETRHCKCCGKTLPVEYFERYAGGLRRVCKACRRNESGVSERFKDFTARELIEELRSRGYKGTLKLVRIEEVKL